MTSIPSAPGIYRITCTVNGLPYIGSAVNLRNRYNNHFGELRRNEHHNPKLQNAFNKYGPSAFTFEVIEVILVPELLTAREQYWLDKLKPFGNKGFNIDRIAGSRQGHTFSPESRAKMSIAHIGQVSHNRGKKASPETRAKQRAAKLGKPSARRDYTPSPETLAKISATKKGKPNPHAGVKHSPEARKKIGLASLGRKHTPEARTKLSIALRGNKNGAKRPLQNTTEDVS